MAEGLRRRPFWEEPTTSSTTVDEFSAPLPEDQRPSPLNSDQDFLRGFYSTQRGLEAGDLYRRADQLEVEGRLQKAAAVREEAQRYEEAAAGLRPRVGSFSDVRNVGDTVDYIQSGLGQVAPTMGPPLAAGVAGAVGGALIGGPVGAYLGGAAAGSAAAFPMEAGEQASSQQADPYIRENTTAEQRLREQNIKGAQNAALESAFPAIFGGRVVGGAARRIAGEALKNSPLRRTLAVGRETAIESGTEFTQTLTGQASLSRLNPNRDTTHDYIEQIDSIILGALGGSSVSLGTTVPGYVAEKVGQRAEQKADVALRDIGRAGAELQLRTITQMQQRGEAVGLDVPLKRSMMFDPVDEKDRAEFQELAREYQQKITAFGEDSPEVAEVVGKTEKFFYNKHPEWKVIQEGIMSREAINTGGGTNTLRLGPEGTPTQENPDVNMLPDQPVAMFPESTEGAAKFTRQHVRKGEERRQLMQWKRQGFLPEEGIDAAQETPLGQWLEKRRAAPEEVQAEVASMIRDIDRRLRSAKEGQVQQLQAEKEALQQAKTYGDYYKALDNYTVLEFPADVVQGRFTPQDAAQQQRSSELMTSKQERDQLNDEQGIRLQLKIGGQPRWVYRDDVIKHARNFFREELRAFPDGPARDEAALLMGVFADPRVKNVSIRNEDGTYTRITQDTANLEDPRHRAALKLDPPKRGYKFGKRPQDPAYSLESAERGPYVSYGEYTNEQGRRRTSAAVFDERSPQESAEDLYERRDEIEEMEMQRRRAEERLAEARPNSPQARQAKMQLNRLNRALTRYFDEFGGALRDQTRVPVTAENPIIQPAPKKVSRGTPSLTPRRPKAPPVRGETEVPSVRKIALDAQKEAGWNPDWPFIPADLGNADFRAQIANDPGISTELKTAIFEAGKKLGVVPANEVPRGTLPPPKVPKPAPVRKSTGTQPQPTTNEARTAQPIVGDIWRQNGVKIVSTNLQGVHGRGLALQAKQKGYIKQGQNVDFDSSPKDAPVITLAVKGAAPETAKIKGRAFSEQTVGKNLDLLKSELNKLVKHARANPDTDFYLPFIGLGFGEGNSAEIMPLLQKAAQERNIFLISRDQATVTKYADTFRPGVRRDATTRNVPRETSEAWREGLPEHTIDRNLKTLASTDPKTGEIKINPVETVQEFFDYFEGKVNRPTSNQKRVVLNRLANSGWTRDKIRNLITTPGLANRFLVLHEADHVANLKADLEVYQRNKNIMSPGKIAVETRASETALNQLEKEVASGRKASKQFDETPGSVFYGQLAKNLKEQGFQIQQDPDTGEVMLVRDDSNITNAQDGTPFKKANWTWSRAKKGVDVSAETYENLCISCAGHVIKQLRTNGLAAVKTSFRHKLPGTEVFTPHFVALTQLPNGKYYIVDDPQKNLYKVTGKGKIQVIKNEYEPVFIELTAKNLEAHYGITEAQAEEQYTLMNPSLRKALGSLAKQFFAERNIVPDRGFDGLIDSLKENFVALKKSMQLGPEEVAAISTQEDAVRWLVRAFGAEMRDPNKLGWMRGEDMDFSAGDYNPYTDFMRLALNSHDPLSIAFHEGMHKFVKKLKETNPALYDRMVKAATAPHIVKQMEKLLYDMPSGYRAIDQLRLGQDPEEFVAYAFQLYAASRAAHGPTFNIQPSLKQIFRKIMESIARVLGVMTHARATEQIFDALYEGRVQRDGIGSLQKYNERSFQEYSEDAMKAIKSSVPRIVSSPIIQLQQITNAQGQQIQAFKKLANLWHSEPRKGGEAGVLQRTMQLGGQYMNRWHKILQDHNATKEDLQAALKNFQAWRDPRNALERDIQTFFNVMWKYQFTGPNAVKVLKVVDEETGDMEWVTPARVRNYFPRVWNVENILANEIEFREVMREESRGKLTDEQITNFIDMLRATNGTEAGSELQQYRADFSPYNAAINARVFDFINENNAHKFAKFQEQNMGKIMDRYIRQATHRREHSRTFGHDGKAIKEIFKQAQREGATPEQIAYAEKVVKGMEGRLGTDKVSDLAREFMVGAMSLTNFAVLPLALFSSMVDPLGVTARTDSWAGAAKTFKAGFKQILNDARKVKTPDQELTEYLGIIEEDMVQDILNNLERGMYMNEKLRRMNKFFFKSIGLEQWTRGTRIGAMRASLEYLKKNANNAEALAELGLEPGMIQEVEDRIALKPGEFRDGDQTEQARRVQNAVYRMVDEAILRPSAGTRPLWMSDMRFRLFGHLKSYTFTFHNQIIRGLWEKAKKVDNPGAAALAFAPLLAYVPVMLAADMARDMLKGDDRERDWDEVLGRALQRSAILGMGTFLMDIEDDMDYGGLPTNTLLGPVVDNALNLGRTAINPDASFTNAGAKLLPYNALWRKWGEE